MNQTKLKLRKHFTKFMPRPIHRWEFLLRGLISKKRISYSQNAEDIILSDIFKKQKKGFYVDIGAYHPIKYSNTFLLYKKGWRGITIDANPDIKTTFNIIRPRDIHIVSGVGKQKGELYYHQFSDPAVNTFSDIESENFKNKSWIKYYGKTKVDILPLSDILDGLSLNKIDVMNIDVEGLDLEVLESNNWSKYCPKVIVIEDHEFNFNTEPFSTIHKYLINKSYELKHRIKFSSIYEKCN